MKPNPYTRNKAPLNATMNVVPYIDVMLVLLVIFMVTAPMLTTGIDVSLPNASADALPANPLPPVVLTMQDTGELFYTDQENSDIAISETDLQNKLIALHQSSEDMQVMIYADKGNQYENVIELMDMIKQTGISKVGLLTEKPMPSMPLAEQTQ